MGAKLSLWFWFSRHKLWPHIRLIPPPRCCMCRTKKGERTAWCSPYPRTGLTNCSGSGPGSCLCLTCPWGWGLLHRFQNSCYFFYILCIPQIPKYIYLQSLRPILVLQYIAGWFAAWYRGLSLVFYGYSLTWYQNIFICSSSFCLAPWSASAWFPSAPSALCIVSYSVGSLYSKFTPIKFAYQFS